MTFIEGARAVAEMLFAQKRPAALGLRRSDDFRPIADIQKRWHRIRMSDFADLDPTICKWVKATSSTLFTEWAGKPSRFFHLPGQPPFECFPIVVFPPAGRDVTVQAVSLDTNDGAEMMEIWEGPAASLDDMLAVAVAKVEQWKARA